jgi:calcineurin-like phosphoesterase family protein
VLHNGRMIYFTADTHFNDPRVLRIDRRPFRNISAHDEGLVAEWNRVVMPEDEIWHLGDFARGPADLKAGLLHRLNGRKHLIVGNNDDADTLESPSWDSVETYAEIVVDDTRLILCHYAFRTWNQMGKGSVNLHGHSHGRLKTMPRQYDVGVDVFRHRPVSLGEILASRRRIRPANADSSVSTTASDGIASER